MPVRISKLRLGSERSGVSRQLAIGGLQGAELWRELISGTAALEGRERERESRKTYLTIFCSKIWDALTGNELYSFEHKHIVRACAFSEDTHMFLTGGVEKILRIYDMNRPDAAPRELDKTPGSVRTLWDVRSGKIVQTLETKAPVTKCNFWLVKSYDMSCTVESASLEPKSGSKFITGGEDMWVHVYDFFTGEEIDALMNQEQI
ncbi:hypothetical protein ZWY2020_028637 [Hordeum vulgare]|nr:hypothetical protein ZWY2020_028637 [Hordeum vulgare]